MKQQTKKIPFVTREEATEKTLHYFDGDELATNVWINKYALKNSEGLLLESSPNQMHRRIASELARIEAKYPNGLSEQEIFNLLKSFKYIVPQGGPMAGIGNNEQYVSLSNCFVIGNEGMSDSYGSIMKTDEEQIQLMKRRGGVGHDLSDIRPFGSQVLNSALTSTGVVPFMERFSNSTREVAQDGRRGALMLSIDIKHPDAERFIDAKLEGTKVTGANVSVKISDAFMQAITSGEAFVQQYPVDAHNPSVKKTIDPQDIWGKVVHNAWKSAEPGILFWDTIIRESLADCYAQEGFKTVSTNPCGEIPLCPYDSCRLLAINLYSYVDNPFTKQAAFNFTLFQQHVGYATRLMDDIVDLELEKIDRIIAKIKSDPEPSEIKSRELMLWERIKDKCERGRRVGIGVTAEADMLAALDLQYATPVANDFCEEIHRTLALEAYASSVVLAKERGEFPIYNYEKEQLNPFLNRLINESPTLNTDLKKYGRRNIALLTIAPTGTTSLMTQTSSGIEPVFKVAYKRRKKIHASNDKDKVDFVDELGDHWQEFFVVHPKFKVWLKEQGVNDKQLQQLTDEELDKYIQQSPYHNSTANEIDWLSKVSLQGAVQKWVDHSISVTVNLPTHVTEQEVGAIYTKAWEVGCKGITVYREGSRDGVLVSDKPASVVETIGAKERPERLSAKVIRFINNGEKWMAVIGLLAGNPYEIFTGRTDVGFFLPEAIEDGWVIKTTTFDNQSRYDFQYQDSEGFNITIEGLSRTFDKEYWNYAKLISGVLRHGMPLNAVVHLVSNLNLNNESLLSWKSGVVRALSKFIKNGTQSIKNNCPSCSENGLVYEEGCLHCNSCGYSECS